MKRETGTPSEHDNTIESTGSTRKLPMFRYRDGLNGAPIPENIPTHTPFNPIRRPNPKSDDQLVISVSGWDSTAVPLPCIGETFRVADNKIEQINAWDARLATAEKKTPKRRSAEMDLFICKILLSLSSAFQSTPWPGYKDG